MKLFLLSAACLGIGFVAHLMQRPSISDLEQQATVAWNEGRLEAAEGLARAALGRKSDSVRAREVLLQLSHAQLRPEIPLTLALADYASGKSQERTLAELGRMALSCNLFRLADGYFAEGVDRFPKNGAIQRQYVAISGLRLDAEEMQRRLTQWEQHRAPTADLVIMSLGLWSIDSRGVEPSETWLRAAVEADATDVGSRLGLGRCLLAMGRYRECVELLKPYSQHPRAGLLLAVVDATTQDASAAAELLPTAEPTEMRGEYWFARGLIALEQRDISVAEEALEKAVHWQPLNKSYRSRYCDVLRRQHRTEQLQRHVKELEIVVRIVQRSMQPGVSDDAVALGELAESCRSVGADEAARLISQAVRQ